MYHRKYTKKDIKTIRNRLKNRLALKNAILRRDDHKCVVCGTSETLQVTHKKPIEKFPELAFEPSNLETLCNKHKWKRRKLFKFII